MKRFAWDVLFRGDFNAVDAHWVTFSASLITVDDSDIPLALVVASNFDGLRNSSATCNAPALAELRAACYSEVLCVLKLFLTRG